MGGHMTNNQIVTLYEKSGLSIEELASAFEMDSEVIKMALANGSSKYHKEVKKNDKLALNMDMAVIVMNESLFAEDEGVRLRASKFIINEMQGRHDVVNMKGMVPNVNLINVQFSKALELEKRILNKTSIEVESESQHVAA